MARGETTSKLLDPGFKKKRRRGDEVVGEWWRRESRFEVEDGGRGQSGRSKASKNLFLSTKGLDDVSGGSGLEDHPQGKTWSWIGGSGLEDHPQGKTFISKFVFFCNKCPKCVTIQVFISVLFGRKSLFSKSPLLVLSQVQHVPSPVSRESQVKSISQLSN